MELQRRTTELAAQGLGLAVITYDPPAVLKRFADEHHITYPLLSDQGSLDHPRLRPAEHDRRTRVARLRRAVPRHLRARRVGPGDVARFFEAAYQERNTVASILARQGSAVGGGPVVALQTSHLTVQAALSDARRLARGAGSRCRSR